MAMRDTQLTGIEKAGILLMALGTGIAAQVFKHLSEPEIEKLSAQIIKLRNVDASVVEAVIAEFEEMRTKSVGPAIGGKDFAAEVLEQVVGGEKAAEVLGRASSSSYARPFESLWNVDSAKLSRVLEKEHPQISALVLTYLPSDKSASVLSELSPEVQSEVAHRICTMDEIEHDVLLAIEEALVSRLSASGSQAAASGGPKTLVEILNSVTRSTERNILDSLIEQDPSVGEEVRSMIFVFEDLPKLEDRTVQIVLREVDQEDLRLSLKSADEVIKQLVFRNMSERAAEMLKEDLELLSNVRPQDVEAAQQKIVSVVRRLIASGEAVLKSGDEPAELTTSEAPVAEMSEEEMERQMLEQMNTGEATSEQSDQEAQAA